MKAVIVTGGRYNKLIQKFGKEAAAIGFAVVVDDMMEALNRQKVTLMIEDNKQTIYYNENNYQEQLAKAIEARKNGCLVQLLPE